MLKVIKCINNGKIVDCVPLLHSNYEFYNEQTNSVKLLISGTDTVGVIDLDSGKFSEKYWNYLCDFELSDCKNNDFFLGKNYFYLVDNNDLNYLKELIKNNA
jgi:hypothetical protein